MLNFQIFVILLSVQLIARCCGQRFYGDDFVGGEKSERASNSCEDRKTPGLICESCELLSTCIRTSRGWETMPVLPCDTQNGYYCHAQLGSCSNMTGPCHPLGLDSNFQCPSEGTFPDPYDCQRYHVCYFMQGTLVSAPMDCGGDRAYDSKTKRCTQTVLSSICQEQQYQCPYVGYAAAWPSDHNIFYICISPHGAAEDGTTNLIYPSLYRCADGDYFENYTCYTGSTVETARPTMRPPASYPHVPVQEPSYIPASVGTQAPPTAASTSTPTKQPTAQQPENDNPTVCNERGLIPDKQDCRKYYQCRRKNSQPIPKTCPSGTHFVSAIASCSLGDC